MNKENLKKLNFIIEVVADWCCCGWTIDYYCGRADSFVFRCVGHDGEDSRNPDKQYGFEIMSDDIDEVIEQVFNKIKTNKYAKRRLED